MTRASFRINGRPMSEYVAFAAYLMRKHILGSSPCRRALRVLGRVWTGKTAVSVGDQNDRFFHFGWETLSVVPPADHLANIARARLPFADNSVDLVNASHVAEHLRDSDLNHFLCETYRVLQVGGVLRIVVPDFGGFLESYHRDGLSKHFDWRMSADGLTMREFKENQVRMGREDPAVLLPHNGLISIVASYTNGHPLPIASKEEVDKQLSNGDLDSFIHWCISLKDASQEDYGHYNAYTFERLSRFLKKAGFSTTVRSKYGEWDGIRLFKGIDRDEVRTISLYVNATK